MRVSRCAPLLALSLSFPAFAAPPTCPTDGQRAELRVFRDRIADAPTTEQAQKIALKQTRLGHQAIHRASKMLDDSAALADADAKLTAFEADVQAARSPAEVAGRFDTLMSASPMAGSCDYTGVEIVIIVIGFVLGILPGILFLLLFC